MATMEERLAALEQEQAALKQENAVLKAKSEQEQEALKKAIEIQMIALRALATKEAFEQLRETVKESQEQNSKLFNVLINQGSLHNQRMAETQNQLIEQDGKIIGLQTDMRQGFAEMRQQFEQQGVTIVELDGKVIGLQTEMRQRFDLQDARSEVQDQKIDQILRLLTNKSQQDEL